MKALNYFYFILFLGIFIGCSSQKIEDNPNKEEKTKINPYSEFIELKLPLKLEAPDSKNGLQEMKALGLDVQSHMNSNPKRTYFKTSDGINVEVKGFDHDGDYELVFSVLDDTAKMFGDSISVTYYQTIAGANYFSQISYSEVKVENNIIIVQTKTSTTSPAPNTNLEDPKLIVEKTDDKSTYKIMANSIIKN